mmetsp:Transcript_27378/g.35900  ORF Transcript_27378/g.35900 Transcript_27378/m.35900 type:complete len:236 (+) Transcript_27378:260-967(+)
MRHLAGLLPFIAYAGCFKHPAYSHFLDFTSTIPGNECNLQNRGLSAGNANTRCLLQCWCSHLRLITSIISEDLWSLQNLALSPGNAKAGCFWQFSDSHLRLTTSIIPGLSEEWSLQKEALDPENPKHAYFVHPGATHILFAGIGLGSFLDFEGLVEVFSNCDTFRFIDNMWVGSGGVPESVLIFILLDIVTGTVPLIFDRPFPGSFICARTLPDFLTRGGANTGMGIGTTGTIIA